MEKPSGGCSMRGFIWIYMGLYGFIWVYMGLYGFIWVYMGLYGFIWIYMGLYGFIWIYMGLYGFIWVYMGLYGFIWIYMGLYYLFISNILGMIRTYHNGTCSCPWLNPHVMDHRASRYDRLDAESQTPQ